MNKTAMSKLIQKFQDNISWIEDNLPEGYTKGGSISVLNDCIREAQSLLPIEQEHDTDNNIDNSSDNRLSKWLGHILSPQTKITMVQAKEDNKQNELVVIKRSEFERIKSLSLCGHYSDSTIKEIHKIKPFPASEVFEAGMKFNSKTYKYPTYTDYEQNKLKGK